jgi:hypothetical protein
MNERRFHFELFADYFQFYLQDESADGNLGDSWTQEAVDRLIAVAPGTVGVGTARNMMVPVDVVLCDAAPYVSNDGWDHVVECSFEVPTGRIVIAGCTDHFPDAARIDVAPGTYRARAYFGGLETLSDDGLEGNDRYEIRLWPGPAILPTIVKARNTVAGN